MGTRRGPRAPVPPRPGPGRKPRIPGGRSPPAPRARPAQASPRRPPTGDQRLRLLHPHSPQHLARQLLLNERTEWEVGVSADWELDLFGRLRGTVASAEARQRIEHERQRDAALQLVSEVARGYYEYRGIARQQRITQQNLDLLRKTTTLAQKLFDMGETSEFDVVRARGQRQLIQARLPELDARRHDVSNRLAALLAMNARDLRERLDQADAPRDLPSPRLPGLRSDLLRRRPDVRAAKAALDAATADAGAARADRFPRFSLVGQIGRTAESASDLADSDSDQTRGGLVLDWPIWEGGALRAREDIREAEVEEALARYEQQVLDAFADVETALVAFLRERDIAARLGEAEVSSLRAVTLARDLYNAGEETFLSVLDAERELISVQDQLTLSETRVALALVHLYTALGGSWTLQDLHP